MASLKIAIAGASGRMGRALVEVVLSAPDLRLVTVLEQKGNPNIGRDAGELAGAPCGVRIGDDVAKSIVGADVFIDFTRPEGQEIIASYNNRVPSAAVTERHKDQYPPVRLVKVEEVFGGWNKAMADYFASGAKFDKLFAGG